MGLGDEQDAGSLGGAEVRVFWDDDNGSGSVLDLGGGPFATTSGRGHFFFFLGLPTAGAARAILNYQSTSRHLWLPVRCRQPRQQLPHNTLNAVSGRT
jgi:hypothetical protein